jgi:hypothetical protein
MRVLAKTIRRNRLTFPALLLSAACTSAFADQAMIIDPSGNIGIGTGSPGEAVDVLRVEAASRFQLTSESDDPVAAPQFIQRRARSGLAAVQAGDNLGLFSFRGHTGSGYSFSKAIIAAQATEDWSPTANGTQIAFATTPNGGTSPATVMTLTNDGRILINGSQLNVPDYVFDDAYDMLPLDELKEFIERNQHLPGVPSAQEVNSGDFDLVGAQMNLLEKVEELTLYTLDQHEQIKRQQRVIEQQRVELSQQREQLGAGYEFFMSKLAAMEEKLNNISQTD